MSSYRHCTLKNYFWKKGKNLFNQIQITKERPEAHNNTKYSYLPKLADQQSHNIPKVTHPFHWYSNHLRSLKPTLPNNLQLYSIHEGYDGRRQSQLHKLNVCQANEANLQLTFSKLYLFNISTKICESDSQMMSFHPKDHPLSTTILIVRASIRLLEYWPL